MLKIASNPSKLFTSTTLPLRRSVAPKLDLFELGGGSKAPVRTSELPAVGRPRPTPRDLLLRASAKAVRGDDAFGNVATQLDRIRALDQGQARKTITILGAGVSGLAAAYELEKLGHTVRILEGNERIGGRLWTKRFDDGSYHELGGMRIPASHDYTRHYVKELGLTLRKFVSSHGTDRAFYDVEGTVTRIADAKKTLFPKFELSAEEASAPSAPAIIGKVVSELLASLTPAEKASLFASELSSARLKQLDRLSMRQYLTTKLGGDAIALSAASDGTEPTLDRALLLFLRDELRKNGEGLEEIAGGMDQLPHGLARRLKARVETSTKVLGIARREDGKVELTLSKNGGPPTKEIAENVICTLPFPVLRKIDAAFSKEKKAAIAQLGYDSATKVLLHAKERFWEKSYGIYGGASHSDRTIRASYYPSDNAEKKDSKVSAEPGVMVGSYAWGADAQALGAMGEAERVAKVIAELSRFHPEVAAPGMIDDAASIVWDQNPWSLGAYAQSLPGQNHLYKAAIQREGNIHFAGEHCSHDQGWIQGSLISALRAVESIVTLELAARETDTRAA